MRSPGMQNRDKEGPLYGPYLQCSVLSNAYGKFHSPGKQLLPSLGGNENKVLVLEQSILDRPDSLSSTPRDE